MPASVTPRWSSRRAIRNILLSEDTLPPSDPPSDSSEADDERQPVLSSEDIPLLEVLKREVEGIEDGSSSDMDASASPPIQRLFRRVRRSSLPEITSAPMAMSEEVFHTPRTERRLRVTAAQAKRASMLAQNKVRNKTERIEVEATQRDRFFDHLLAQLQERGYTLAAFLDYVFNPAIPHLFDWRWKGFFVHKEIVERILGYWTTSAYNKTTRAVVESWAVKHVRKLVGQESTLHYSIRNSVEVKQSCQ